MVHRGNLRRVVGASVAVLLLAVLMAFYVAGRAGADPASCAQHRVQARERAAVVTGEGERVLVVGDSWSVGLGLEDLSRSWASELPGEVHVAGFSGSGFSASASTCGRVSFDRRAPAAVAAVRPAYVVVEGGLNDYDRTDGAIERGFTRLMADLTGQHVVVVGPADAPARTGQVPRVDADLARLSAAHGVPYVSTDDLDLSYLDDGLHLTEAGHEEFGRAVAERIAAVEPALPSVLAH